MAISSGVGISAIKPGVVDSVATRPASPYEGQVIFQKDTDQLLVWNGTAWVIPNSPAQNPMGLELIKHQPIIGTTSSVTISDVFSATYDNYRIVLSGMTPTAGGSSYYLRLSGSTGSTYYWAGNYQAYSSGTSVNIGGAGSSLGIWLGITGGYSGFSADVHNPFKTNSTNSTSSYSSNTWAGVTGGQDNNAVSHTGFTIFHETTTMSNGTISVYGYRK